MGGGALRLPFNSKKPSPNPMKKKNEFNNKIGDAKNRESKTRNPSSASSKDKKDNQKNKQQQQSQGKRNTALTNARNEIGSRVRDAANYISMVQRGEIPGVENQFQSEETRHSQNVNNKQTDKGTQSENRKPTHKSSKSNEQNIVQIPEKQKTTIPSEARNPKNRVTGAMQKVGGKAKSKLRKAKDYVVAMQMGEAPEMKGENPYKNQEKTKPTKTAESNKTKFMQVQEPKESNSRNPRRYSNKEVTKPSKNPKLNQTNEIKRSESARESKVKEITKPHRITPKTSSNRSKE